jgi:hypothetical protein
VGLLRILKGGAMEDFEFKGGQGIRHYEAEAGDPGLEAGFDQIQATAIEYIRKHAKEHGFILIYVASEDDTGIEMGQLAWLPPSDMDTRRPWFVMAMAQFATYLSHHL